MRLHAVLVAAAVLGGGVAAFVGCAEEGRGPVAAGARDEAEGTPLSTGRVLGVEPVSSWDVGSLPVNLILAPGGKYALSSDGGFRQALWAIDAGTGQGVSKIAFQNVKTKGAKPEERAFGMYYGLAASPIEDGKGEVRVFVAMGAFDAVGVVRMSAEGKLTREAMISCKDGDFPAGLALDAKGERLFVANNNPEARPPDVVPSSVAVYDTKTLKEVGRYAFTDAIGGMPNFPLALAVTPDGRKLYVGSQRDDCVYVLDTSDPAKIKPVTKLATGSHPVGLLFNKEGSRLFVANAHSDTVSFVDPRTDAITATVLLRPDIARALAGATPTGLALSPDEKRLYASLGDMNAVAVIDVPDAELEGYASAGWYPSAVVATPDGKRLLVANAKGTTVRNPNPPAGMEKNVSPLRILEGNVTGIAVPAKEELKRQTELVLKNNRLTAKYVDRPNPLKNIGIEAGRIKHVIYIVKENRTYDHVLGDLPQGNGDPKFCAFPREVTPNQHALAERFVLMDNFYDSGEVSGDGWTWSTQAMANEYVVRNVPYSYSDRGRYFDYEGMNNMWLTGGFPAKGPDGKPLSEHPAFKDGAPAVPDVAAAPGGHIWDLATKHKRTVRNYGFFMSNGVNRDGVQVTPDNYPASAGLQPGGRDLGGITNLDFRRFDMDYPDSDAWRIYFEQTKNPLYKWIKTEYGAYKAPSRFAEWNREFQMMLKKDPTGGAVPNLMLVRFCTDHTAGANPGKKSPKAMVADNDYAVGQLVEAVSKSPIWKHCAIFIIEDDAQNGPDHVDAHRSVCFVVSPYIKRGSVDHAFYNTASCLKSIELLLGLPPMCQYDAIASPVGVWGDRPENAEAYEAILPAGPIIGQTNPKEGEVSPISPEARLMRESMEMEFERADKAPADKLNEIIWKLTKGMDAELPATPQGLAGVSVPKVDDDDD